MRLDAKSNVIITSQHSGFVLIRKAYKYQYSVTGHSSHPNKMCVVRNTQLGWCVGLSDLIFKTAVMVIASV